MDKCCKNCSYYGGSETTLKGIMLYCDRYNEFKIFADPMVYFCDDFSINPDLLVNWI